MFKQQGCQGPPLWGCGNLNQGENAWWRGEWSFSAAGRAKGPKDKHPHKEVLNLMAPAPRALRLPERS